jgi:hypothetical protein
LESACESVLRTFAEKRGTAGENYDWNPWLIGSQDRTPDPFKRGSPEADLIIGGQMVL